MEFDHVSVLRLFFVESYALAASIKNGFFKVMQQNVHVVGVIQKLSS